MTHAPHPSITQDRINEAINRRRQSLDNPGFCLACGHEQDGCEPDARNYECEACGKKQVFGADEIILDFGETLRR